MRKFYASQLLGQVAIVCPLSMAYQSKEHLLSWVIISFIDVILIPFLTSLFAFRCALFLIFRAFLSLMQLGLDLGTYLSSCLRRDLITFFV